MKTKNLKFCAFSLIFLSVLTLASCHNDHVIAPRLTPDQKTAFGQSVAGEYEGTYAVFYADGHHEKQERARLDVASYELKHLSFCNFPVSLFAQQLDADSELRQALAEAPRMDIQASYSFGYGTSSGLIKWGFTPMPLSLTLNYGGSDHHITIVLKNNYTYYETNSEAFSNPRSLGQVAPTLAMNVEAIYDGQQLVEQYDSWTGNDMLILFRFVKD